MNEPMGSTNSGAEGNSIITIIAAKLAPLVNHLEMRARNGQTTSHN